MQRTPHMLRLSLFAAVFAVLGGATAASAAEMPKLASAVSGGVVDGPFNRRQLVQGPMQGPPNATNATGGRPPLPQGTGGGGGMPSLPAGGSKPSAAYFVNATVALSGPTVITFTPSAQGAFVATMATTVSVPSDAVFISAVTPAASGRHLLAAGGVNVAFGVASPMANMAAQTATDVTTATAGAGATAFVASLNVALAAAGAPAVTAMTVLTPAAVTTAGAAAPPPATTPKTSGAGRKSSAAAVVAAVLAAAALLV